MTLAFSAALEVSILNWVKGTAFPTAPTTVEFGLLTAEPDHDGVNLNELNGNGYARQLVVFGAITTVARISSMLNTNSLIFGPVITTDWFPALYGAFFNGADDTLLAYGPLAAQRVAPVGDTISFGANSLQLRCQ